MLERDQIERIESEKLAKQLEIERYQAELVERERAEAERVELERIAQRESRIKAERRALERFEQERLERLLEKQLTITAFRGSTTAPVSHDVPSEQSEKEQSTVSTITDPDKPSEPNLKPIEPKPELDFKPELESEHKVVIEAKSMQAVVDITNLVSHIKGEVTLENLLLYATKQSLSKLSQFNAFYEKGILRQQPQINLGYSVFVGGHSKTLILPDCRNNSIADFSAQLAELKVLYESGEVLDLLRPTFTVVSLADYGVETFTPELEGNTVAALGVGCISTKIKIENASTIHCPAITIILSYNPLVINDFQAAQFIKEVAHQLNII